MGASSALSISVPGFECTGGLARVRQREAVRSLGTCCDGSWGPALPAPGGSMLQVSPSCQVPVCCRQNPREGKSEKRG